MRQLIWTLPPEKEGDQPVTKGAVLVNATTLVFNDGGTQRADTFAVCEDPDTGRLASINVTELERRGMNPHIEPRLREEINRIETEQRMRAEIAAKLHEQGVNAPPPGAMQKKIIPAGFVPPGGFRPPGRRPR